MDLQHIEDFESELDLAEDSLRKIRSKHDPTLDGQIEVIVEEGVKAYLLITPPKIGGNPVSLQDVYRRIEEEGIANFDRLSVQEAVKKRVFNEKILLSTGVRPVEGEDGYLVYKFTEGEVIPNQLVAVLVPETTGVDGIDVRGRRIRAKAGEPVRLRLGQGLSLTKDGLRVYAKKYGRIVWKNEGVKIREIKKGGREQVRLPVSVILDVTRGEDEAKKRGAKLLGLDTREVSCIRIDEGGRRFRVYKGHRRFPIPPSLTLDGEVSKIDLGKIEKIWCELEERIGRTKRVGRFDLESRLSLDIRSGGLEAYLTVFSPRLEEESKVSPEDVERYLASRDIQPLDDQKIKEIFDKRLFNKPVLVARGVPPKRGASGRFLFRIKSGEDVLPGQLLGVRSRPTVGTPGRSVTGGIIPGEVGEEAELSIGPGVKISQDGLRVFSRCHGRVFWKRGEVYIEPKREIPAEEDSYPFCIISARNIEEGVKRGAELLALSEKDLTAEIVSKKKGWFRLKISLNKQDDEDGKMDEERLEALQKMEDQLSDLQGAIEGGDFEVLEQMESQLQLLEGSLSKIRADYDPNLDGQVIIEVKDDIKAYITVTYPKIGGKAATYDQAIEEIEKKGIVNYDKGLIKRIFQNKDFNRRFLISTGRAPTKGEDGFLRFKYGDDEEVRDVYPGLLLYLKTPPTYGESGVDVTGQKIPAILGNDVEVLADRGVLVSEDGLRGYSIEYGKVFWEQGKVAVERVYEIKGDVNASVGNVDFDGRVNIGGSVEDGMKVEASSNITIFGNVGNAEVVSGGDVLVYGEVSGGGNAKIIAKGNVKLKVCMSCKIEAGGGVFIEDVLKDCKVDAKNVVVKGKVGMISGGVIKAQEVVDAVIVGEEKKSPLQVIAGRKIGASDVIRGGVKIQIGKQREEIKKTKTKTCFLLEDGKIVEKPYEEEKVTPLILHNPIRKEEIGDLNFSVIVEEPSEEESIKEGAMLLGMDPSKLDSIEVPMEVGEEDTVAAEAEESKEEGGRRFWVFPKGVEGPWGEKEPPKEIQPSIDGSYKLKNTDEGLFLAVYPPEGKGKRIEEESIISEIKKEGYLNIDFELVSSCVREAKGTPVRIGPRQRIPLIDGMVDIQVAEDYSKATMTITPPKEGGLPVKFEDVMSTLHERGVVFGIKEDVISDAISSNKFNTPIIVAEQVAPAVANKFRIEYKVDIKRDKIVFTEDGQGRVDFKQLNLIVNVKKGDLLAVKTPAGDKGAPGRKVNGEEIPPPPPQDVSFPAGKNTEISEDGMELFSSIDGHVVFANERINIEPVYEIKEDVCMETGNIDFFGSVVIGGSVRDGFKVRADGEIQVRGGVGKANLFAGGDIIVNGGIQGKGEATLRSDGDIVGKFVENAILKARKDIIISEEVLHSYLDAGRKITVLGKLGSVVGGKLRAEEELSAKVLGSKANTKTLVEVGIRPKIREQLMKLDKMIQEDGKKFERIGLDINTLNKMRERMGKLTPERETLFLRLKNTQKLLEMKLRSYNERREILLNQLAMAKGGIVNVSEKVFPGVKIAIRAADIDIKEPYKATTFIFEGGEVKAKEYQLPK